MQAYRPSLLMYGMHLGAMVWVHNCVYIIHNTVMHLIIYGG